MSEASPSAASTSTLWKIFAATVTVVLAALFARFGIPLVAILGVSEPSVVAVLTDTDVKVTPSTSSASDTDTDVKATQALEPLTPKP